MVRAEITEGKTVQVAAVGGVAERAEVGVVRGFDAHGAAGACQPVKFFHRPDDVIHVLNDMNREHTIETVIGEGIRGEVEIAEDVGAAGGIAVDADRAGLLVNPAAYVQNSQFSRIAIFRHSSSTSTANPA